MAQKCLECLVVDGNYSKARIGGLLLGLISIAFFIWLIVLTVTLGKDEDSDANTNAPQDFEWEEIVATCSDNGDNKINTTSKDNRKKCGEWANNFNDAKFIFYSDDKTCILYKECGEMEGRIANKPGFTYMKIDNDNWVTFDTSDVTCGKEKSSFQAIYKVDSLEKCKEEASKSDDGKFIFFSNSSLLGTETPGCYFYNKCDLKNLHSSDYSGKTYQRKIKEE